LALGWLLGGEVRSGGPSDARFKKRVPYEDFSVDGVPIESWAAIKNFSYLGPAGFAAFRFLN